MAEKELAVKKKGISSKGEELRAYWMFILPGFIMYFIVMAFPTVFSLFLSISKHKFVKKLYSDKCFSCFK